MAETPTAAQAQETIERRVPEALQPKAKVVKGCQCKQCEHVRLVQAGFRIEHLEHDLQALREVVRRAEERIRASADRAGTRGDVMLCTSGAYLLSGDILREETEGLMGESPCPPPA